MQISSLAEAVGVSAKTIRFYEQRGLLPPPPRTLGGYRDYPPEAIPRLRFIRNARATGLRLADIDGILALRDNGQDALCARVESSSSPSTSDQIDRRLSDLRATRGMFRDLARRAAEVDPDTCAEADICTILNNGTHAPAALRGRKPRDPQPRGGSR